MIFLQGFSFSIEDLIFEWEAIGVFDWILPFLLIFAVIAGILSTTRILGNHRGVNVIISMVIALLALRTGLVQAFFAELFPRFAIGLSILIVIVLLAGLFIVPEDLKGWFIGFASAGAVIGLVVVILTFGEFDWFNSFFWQDYLGVIIGGILLLVLIIAVFITSGEKPKPKSFKLPLGPLRDMLK